MIRKLVGDQEERLELLAPGSAFLMRLLLPVHLWNLPTKQTLTSHYSAHTNRKIKHKKLQLGLKWTEAPAFYPWFQFSHSSCPTLWDRRTAAFPVHHQLLESTHTHAHWVDDAIQPSHPLSSPSPPAFNLSQHQGLFQWVSSSHQVATVLELQLQHQAFQWIFSTGFL